VIGIIATWGVGLTATTQWRNAHAPPPPSDRPLAIAGDGFVSSASCRACHPSEHASWHASFHRTMTQPATPANVIPPLDGLELIHGGVLYRIDRDADRFRVRSRPVAAPPTAFGPPREIALLTGSHHQQNFWLTTGVGRALEPFPFGWLIADSKWAPLGDTFLAPPDVADARGGAGAWNNGCLHCHSTHGRPRGRADGSFDTRVTELGIACESCHGEGREHIARQRHPLRRYLAHLTDGPDPSIVNPARLTGPASALACGQCHSIWAFESAAAEAGVNRDGSQFRPGDPILGDRFVTHPTTPDHIAQKEQLRAANPHFFEDSFWPDGMVRVTGREYNGIERSPCFQSGQFSCLSCHEMHPAKTDRATLQTWAISQMKSDARSDRACLQCHEPIAQDIAAHTRHAPDSAGSRCYDCHMPHSSFGLLRAVRSHQVSSPTADESVRHGRPNACNLCHLDQPLAWTAEKLNAWYGQPVPALSSDDRAIAAGAKWLLQGDAGQRGLIAWSMGWTPAQQAAGRGWLAPYLAITLNDPYSAVRYAAWKSLRTLPGYEAFAFDYVASDDVTFDAANRAYQQFLARPPAAPPSFPPHILLEPSGQFQAAPYQRLLDARDNRRIYLVE
jgi:hypothetical protein